MKSTPTQGKPKRRKNRIIKRNCGHLLGKLDDVLPCIYIASYMPYERPQIINNAAAGIFFVSAIEANNSWDPLREGLLIPLKLCRDENMRASLLEAVALLNSRLRMADKRWAVQNCLDKAFNGDLYLEEEILDGEVALLPTPELFRILHESFEYITEVVDNTKASVRITKTSPFRWKSHGELMAWFHHHYDWNRYSTWPVLTPFLIFKEPDVLDKYRHNLRLRDTLVRPAEQPAKYFTIRPDLPNAKPRVQLEMGRHGWAQLHLWLDEATTMIRLSEAYDPFLNLLFWAHEVGTSDLPTEITIDEEGPETTLTILCTDDPERVLLRVTRMYKNQILLEGIVARADLAAALKAELRQFFEEEFSPENWTYTNSLEGPIKLKETVLSHPWLTTKTDINQD